MVYKLTQDIWWGDANSVIDLGPQVGAVLTVCENKDYTKVIGKCNQTINSTTPYFRLARNDYVAVDATYLATLDSILDAVTAGQYKPFLIHCWAGMHRSPNTALYAAVRRAGYTKENYEFLKKEMLNLKPDVQYFKFGKSMDAELQKRCGM